MDRTPANLAGTSRFCTVPIPSPPPVVTDRVDIADLDEPTTWAVPPELAVVSQGSGLPAATTTCNCWLRKDIQCLLSLGCYTEQSLRERLNIEPTERILIKLSSESIPGHRPLQPGEEIYIHDGTVISLLVERTRQWTDTVVK